MTNNFSISQNLDAVPDFVPDDWSEVLPLNCFSVPPLPVDCLPGWLAAYCSQLSDAVQAPIETSIMYALPVLSTCLQGKVEVSPEGGCSRHWESVNLWTLVALPPSSRKSPVVKALTEPLEAWEREQEKKLRPLINEDESKRTISKRRIAELQNQASKEADQSKRNELTREIAGLQEQLDANPVVAPQLFTGDVTNETFQALLQKHGGKMSVLSDEGGIFEVITGLYSNGHANCDVWTQSYSGSALRVNRGGRQTLVANPRSSVGVTIQPEVLADLGRKRLRGNGFLARFLYAVPRCNIGSRDVRRRSSIDPGIQEVYTFNIKRLLDLKPDEPVKLTLDDEAREIYFNFAQYIENRQGLGGEFADVQDWTGKLHGQALRIAGLFHVADHWLSKPTIGKEHMENAVRLCTPLIDHARAAFGMMQADPEADDAAYIVDWLKRGRITETSRGELFKLGRFNRGGGDRLIAALSFLTNAGYIKQTRVTTRKPTEMVLVNPAIYDA